MLAALLVRAGLVLALVWALVCAIAVPEARALDARDVEAVVTVLEKLAAETGNSVFYDEAAAEEWFELDDGSSQIIPAAGFSRESWKTAFDRTITGFIASIPEAEFEQIFGEFIDKIAEAGKLTAQQKQEAASMLRAEMGQLDAVRKQGAPYEAVVDPFGKRLRRLAFGD